MFMVDAIHFNTLLPTFKQKMGKADCLWACVSMRACARQGHRFPVDARLSGISLAGVRVQRMCVTVTSPLPTAACDAPSHKSCRTLLKHTSSHRANQRKQKTHTFCPLKGGEPLPCRWRPLAKGWEPLPPRLSFPPHSTSETMMWIMTVSKQECWEVPEWSDSAGR